MIWPVNLLSSSKLVKIYNVLVGSRVIKSESCEAYGTQFLKHFPSNLYGFLANLFGFSPNFNSKCSTYKYQGEYHVNTMHTMHIYVAFDCEDCIWVSLGAGCSLHVRASL